MICASLFTAFVLPTVARGFEYGSDESTLRSSSDYAAMDQQWSNITKLPTDENDGDDSLPENDGGYYGHRLQAEYPDVIPDNPDSDDSNDSNDTPNIPSTDEIPAPNPKMPTAVMAGLIFFIVLCAGAIAGIFWWRMYYEYEDCGELSCWVWCMTVFLLILMAAAIFVLITYSKIYMMIWCKVADKYSSEASKYSVDYEDPCYE